MRTCADCGREFRKKTQHSCAHYELEFHLEKMNMSQEDSFEALRVGLQDLPDLVYDAVLSGIEVRVM